MSKSKLLSSIALLGFLCSLSSVARATNVDNVLLHDALSKPILDVALGSPAKDANGYVLPIVTSDHSADQAVWSWTSTNSTVYTAPSGGAPGSLKIPASSTTATGRAFLAYFAPSTALTSIDIGQTLTLKFKFRYSVPSNTTPSSSAGNFRIALLSSGGGATNGIATPPNTTPGNSRIVAGNTGAVSVTTNGDISRGYSGYLVDTTAAPSPTTNTIAFWRRTGATSSQQWVGPQNADISANATFSMIGVAGGGTAGALLPDTSTTTITNLYTAALSVTHVSAPVTNSSNVVVTKAVTKLSYTVTDSSGATVMSYSTTENANSSYSSFDTFFVLSMYTASLEIYDLQIIRTSVLPDFTTPPTSQEIKYGQNATFTAVASGAPAPTYRWQKNGVDIPGATTSTLTLTNVTLADAATYSVIATNEAGSSTANATLTVLTTPIVAQDQPGDVSIYETQNATFTAAVKGADPLTYQWQKNGVAVSDDAVISGSNTATLQITGARLSDAGTYQLVVSNTFGTASSRAATLAITPAAPPSITTPPASQTVYEGTDVQFAATVGGTSPFHYQWYKDGVMVVDDGRISGATTATLSLGAARVADSGNYAVAITNLLTLNNPVVSGSAALLVNAAPTPVAPTALPARFVSETGFTAEWSRVTHATGYYLDVASDSAFTNYLAGFQNLDVGAVTSASIAGLSVDTTYYYRVRAYNSSGTSDNSNTISATALTAIAPAITSNGSAVFIAGAASSFTVTATGAPAPRFTASGMPSWLSLDATSGVMSGTPPVSAAGTDFSFTITAQNDQSPDATQTFTALVRSAPAIGEPLTVTTLAGQAGTSGTTDGTGTAARFKLLSGLAVDGSGNIFIADTGNNVIRKSSSTGAVTTFAGKAGTAGSADGTGTAATFDTPSGVAVDASGTLYVADTLNHTIRKITSAGVVTTFAGKAGTAGSTDGALNVALFSAPQGLALDPTGAYLYVADTNNDTIRKITLSSGTVSTLAGTAGSAGSVDGMGAAARFNGPTDIAVDKNGSLYVTDTENSTVRAIAPNGSVTTIAGMAGVTGASDGTGSSAQFSHPGAIGVDGSFNLYVLDTDNHTVRKIVSAAGLVTTLAGSPGTSGSADGAGAVAKFKFPTGLAVNGSGDLYISDTDNHTLRLAGVAHAPTIETQPQSQSVTTGASVTFSVKASGVPAVAYQWNLNGAPISGATSATLTLSNVAASNAGDYTVDVSNIIDTVRSQTATLVVSPAPTTPVGINSGGGGAPGAWFYLSLALLGGARWLSRRARR